MDGEAVQQLVGLSRAPKMIGDFITAPNDWSVLDPASLIKPGPTAKTLVVSTLGAVRDYLKANKDALPLDKMVVHVLSPNAVHVLGPLDLRSRVRETFVAAAATDMLDGFLGKFHSLEDFNLGLQIRFADADERGRILGLMSNVKSEKVSTALDDGVTQVLEARNGVALVSNVAVPNPVLLCGYRAFRDIVQPSTLYVLRVQQGRAGGLPEAGLFEADGGAWKLTTIERVREWLVAALPADVSVLA